MQAQVLTQMPMLVQVLQLLQKLLVVLLQIKAVQNSEISMATLQIILSILILQVALPEGGLLELMAVRRRLMVVPRQLLLLLDFMTIGMAERLLRPIQMLKLTLMLMPEPMLMQEQHLPPTVMLMVVQFPTRVRLGIFLEIL